MNERSTNFIFSIIVLCTMLFGFVQRADAQFYNTGADPLHIGYRQIITDRYRLVFDKKMTEQALLLATSLDTIIPQVSLSMRHTPKRIDIVLHSNIAYSNGLVSWAPRRIEMYSYPSYDGDSQLWLTHLASHEYRHVVQTSKLNYGFTKFLYCLFGEQATGAVLGVYVPTWFLEGDAVVTETALTQSGRGRKASFEQEMKAAILTDGRPTYDQAYFGSFKRYLPDYYHMGYLTVSAARLRYGSELWSNAVERVGRRSWSITPFNRSLRLQTGMRKLGVYAQSTGDWENMWREQEASIIQTPKTILCKSKYDYAEYIKPQIVGSEIIAYRTGPDVLSQFVKIDPDGHEKIIATPSYRNEQDFVLSGDTIVWSERISHPRWENGGKSRIMMRRTDKGIRHKITHGRGHYSAPSVAPDGKRIAAVKIDRSNVNSLIIIDFKGKELSAHAYELDNDISSTQWVDNEKIVYIRTTRNGRHIELYNLKTNEIQQLTDDTFSFVKHLHAAQGKLYFTSDATGIDNIYMLDLSDDFSSTAQLPQPIRITSAKYGADWASVRGNTLYYSDYSASGYSVASTPLTTRATDSPISPMLEVAEKLKSEETQLQSQLPENQPQEHTVRRYSRILHALNPHSWGPINVDATDINVRPGISVSSQNLLGTTIWQAGINIDKSDRDEFFFAKFTYNTLYPKFIFKATYGWQDYEFDALYQLTYQTGEVDYLRVFYDDRQYVAKLKAQVSQPLTFNRGGWLNHIEPYIGATFYDYTPVTIYKQDVEYTPRGFYLSGDAVGYDMYDYRYGDMTYGIYAYTLRRTATRDIGYRWGFTADFAYRNSLFNIDIGECYSINTKFYFPGIGRHHQTAIYARAQKKYLGETYSDIFGYSYYRLYGDAISMPRGYNKVGNTQLQVLGFNYALPLVNPDLSLGWLAYIKRISARFFYDTSHGHATPTVYMDTDGTYAISQTHFTYNSCGVELWADSRFLRLPYEITLGVRYNYLITTEKSNADLILSVSF